MNKAILLLAVLAVSINAQTTPYNVNLSSSLKLKPYLLNNATYADYCSYNNTVILTPTASTNNNTLFTGFNVTGQAYANYTGCPAYYLTFVTSKDDKTPITVNNTQNIDFTNVYVMDNITQVPFKLISQYKTSDNNTKTGNATAQLPAFQLSADKTLGKEVTLQSLNVVVSSAFKLAAVAVSAFIALLF